MAWEDIFSHHVSEKELTSRTYQERLRLNDSNGKTQMV